MKHIHKTTPQSGRLTAIGEPASVEETYKKLSILTHSQLEPAAQIFYLWLNHLSSLCQTQEEIHIHPAEIDVLCGISKTTRWRLLRSLSASKFISKKHITSGRRKGYIAVEVLRPRLAVPPEAEEAYGRLSRRILQRAQLAAEKATQGEPMTVLADTPAADAAPVAPAAPAAPVAKKKRKGSEGEEDKVNNAELQQILESAESMTNFIRFGRAYFSMPDKSKAISTSLDWRSHGGSAADPKVELWTQHQWVGYYWYRVSIYRQKHKMTQVIPNWKWLNRDIKEIRQTKTAMQLYLYIENLVTHFDLICYNLRNFGSSLTLGEDSLLKKQIQGGVENVGVALRKDTINDCYRCMEKGIPIPWSHIH